MRTSILTGTENEFFHARAAYGLSAVKKANGWPLVTQGKFQVSIAIEPQGGRGARRRDRTGVSGEQLDYRRETDRGAQGHRTAHAVSKTRSTTT